MRIIISPAKKMVADLDFLPPKGLPEHLDRTKVLLDYLRGLPYRDLKKLLSCNDQIAGLNFGRFQTMDLTGRLTPALLAYEGIQYRYMAPAVFTRDQLSYVEEHLRILSGFYGLLRPFDGVTPYRLEMQARLKTSFCKDLYAFWGDSLYRSLVREDPVILNLASEEYARAVSAHLEPGVRWVTPVFGERVGDKVAEKGVYVKMARGEMVRWLSERGIRRAEDITAFTGLGYHFHPELSRGDRFVFLKENP